MGGWLEWYVLGALLRLCVDGGREFSCARNLILALPNGEKRELDVVVLVEGRTLVVVECKTGEFRDDIRRCVDLRTRLRVDRTKFVIFNTELHDDPLAGMGKSEEHTIELKQIMRI